MEKAILAQMMYKAGCTPEEYASFYGHISDGIKDGTVLLETIPSVVELLHSLMDTCHRLGEGPSPEDIFDSLDNMDKDDIEAHVNDFRTGVPKRHIIAPAVLA